jgi:hypothetical protein
MSEKEKNEKNEGIVLAASHLFVFQSYEPVSGISKSESEEAAILAFEEESPFPAEQIARGLFFGKDGRVALWGCEQTALPTADGDDYLFPEFYPFFGWERQIGSVEFGITPSGGCLLFFDAGGSVPTEMLGMNCTPEDERFREELRASLLFLGRSVEVMETLHQITLRSVSADSHGKMTAVVERDGEADITWQVEGEGLWQADLRPTSEIQKFRADKRSGERIWLVAKMAAIFLVLLLFGQSSLWGLNFWIEGKEAKETSQSSQVRAIEERADLASRLRDLGESRISVFERLGELNLLRPTGIQFLTVEFEEPDLYKVDGRVTEVRILNQYTEQLRADPRFVIVEALPPRSRDGRVEFEISVRVPSVEAAAL